MNFAFLPYASWLILEGILRLVEISKPNVKKVLDPLSSCTLYSSMVFRTLGIEDSGSGSRIASRFEEVLYFENWSAKASFTSTPTMMYSSTLCCSAIDFDIYIPTQPDDVL